MALMRDVLLTKPKFSNSDLSRINTISAMPGPLYPVFVDEVLAHDTWDIQVDNSVFTLPLVGPLKSSVKQQVAFFFIPSRLYAQTMDTNRLMFDPSSTAKYPTFRGEFRRADATEGSAGNDAPSGLRGLVRPNSLLDLLGVFSGSCSYYVNSPLEYAHPLNAIPLIGYYDIFRNYYANSQESNFYIASRLFDVDTQGYDPHWITAPLSSLDDFIMFVIKNEGIDINSAWSGSFIGTSAPRSPVVSSGYLEYIASGETHHDLGLNLGGLVLRTHQSDLLTAWLSNGTYNTMVTNSRVSTEGDVFTINQLRFASHLLRYDERGIVAGGRFDDWIEAEYGIKLDNKICIPELLGVISSWIGFQEVVSPSATQGEGHSSIGSQMTSLGRGRMHSRHIRFTAKEPGYIMAIYSMVPNVSYSSGIRDYLNKTQFSDTFTPSMDRLGFQPLMKSNFTSAPEYGTNGDLASASTNSIYNLGVGYQPAWSEYTTAYNECHGRLNYLLGDLSYMLLSRQFVEYQAPVSSAQTAPSVFNATSYVLPSHFTYPFADQSEFAENFICQFNFGVRVRRAKSKQVMPTLA